MSKKLLSFLLAAVFMVGALVAGCGGQQQDAKEAKSDKKVLRIACNADFAPFEFQDKDGKYVGFDMDLIRAISKEMGYEADIQNLNFDGLIPALSAKNIDVAISGMTITEERKGKVLFSEPYYKSGLTIAVKSDNNDIKSFSDLKGKKIAVQIGTTSATEAKKIEGADVKEFNSSADTFTELGNSGVDAVINDRPVNDYYIVQNPKAQVKVLDEVLTAEDYGIALNKDDKELGEKINAALKKLKENGEYDKIYAQWFGKKSN
jgi:polar amino acid transport system substrate-binding protein